MIKNYDIVKKANSFREVNGYSLKSPIKIKSLLQQLKIVTIFKGMEGDFSGMALKAADMKFMLVNSNHALGRQNFTICHELYHLFIQEKFSYIMCSDDENEKKEEKNANKFAIDLLLPQEGILDKIPNEELGKNKINQNTILAIEHYYSCSRGALLNRLIDLELITEEYKNELNKDIKLNAKLNGYDTKLYENGNHNLIIGDYGVLAKKLYDDEIISKTHYIELMRDIGINIEELTEQSDEV